MKLCRDCVFYGIVSIRGGSNQEKCYRERKYNVNFANGAEEYFSRYGHYERQHRWPLDLLTGTCGRRARFFQQKERAF